MKSVRKIVAGGREIMFSFNDEGINNAENKNFTENLKNKWDELHDVKKIFRYYINKIKEKVVGVYLLQLNPDRGNKRRLPVHIDSICQPFDKDSFNFNKVSADEVIMSISNENDADNHSILVNVSPISRYHSLICPSITKCLPQVITEESLILVLEIMFLAQDRNMRIGFNSLCALASVNHLHYHILFEEYTLPVENMECKHLSGELYYTESPHSIPAFCFQTSNPQNIKSISKSIFKLIKYLLQQNIAHNMIITRGSDFSGDDKNEVFRIVVWPRRSCIGVKQFKAFNVALCEMSGWFPIYNKEDFDSLQAEDLKQELQKWKYNNFQMLCDEVKNIFR